MFQTKWRFLIKVIVAVIGLDTLTVYGINGNVTGRTDVSIDSVLTYTDGWPMLQTVLRLTVAADEWRLSTRCVAVTVIQHSTHSRRQYSSRQQSTTSQPFRRGDTSLLTNRDCKLHASSMQWAWLVTAAAAAAAMLMSVQPVDAVTETMSIDRLRFSAVTAHAAVNALIRTLAHRSMQ